ncbi:glucosamine-6-phosphate deaminase [Bacillaceae bacterium S4-13-56]
MKLIEVKDHVEMSRKACDILVERVTELSHPVLGLATGSTPKKVYDCLRKKPISFRDVTTFNLDEYVGIAPNDPNSYRFYMDHIFFNHVDIQTSSTNVPSGYGLDLQKECQDYEKKIRDAGGIDVQLLGIGVNGHIGFNEPRTPFNSRTHVVELSESTRKANARFFERMEDVPKQAITMGIETILESKEIILLASGLKKAKAIERLLYGDISEDFPASALRNHPNVKIIADHEALSMVYPALTGINTPTSSFK